MSNNFIKKLLPRKIIIRSWYWVEIDNQMEAELHWIFLLIEIESYDRALRCVEQFRKKYEGMGMPRWVSETHSTICRAEAMLNVLMDDDDETDSNNQV